MRISKLLILTLFAVGVVSSCITVHPVGTTNSIAFSGANQIMATSDDTLMFDKLINNLKMNGFTFETIDRVNGFINVKPKFHPNYPGPYNAITMTLNVVFIKESGANKILLSGSYFKDAFNAPDESGQVMFTNSSTAARVVFDEFVRQLQGIPNITITYRKI